MALNRLTERIWIYPYEEERDRPNLGYIRGDRWSLAVDAGHSEKHTRAFYAALEAASLPLPSLTVLTHWHWDHTFGMHAVHGLCAANERTAKYLEDFGARLHQEGPAFFLALDERISREYAQDAPVIVTLPDITFRGEVRLDAGRCPIRIFQAEAPHTDDSTLIDIPGEKVLFLGDAACGALPDWQKDPALCEKLAETIRATHADICLEGHWTPVSAAEETADLVNETT